MRIEREAALKQCSRGAQCKVLDLVSIRSAPLPDSNSSVGLFLPFHGAPEGCAALDRKVGSFEGPEISGPLRGGEGSLRRLFGDTGRAI